MNGNSYIINFDTKEKMISYIATLNVAYRCLNDYKLKIYNSYRDFFLDGIIIIYSF